MNKITTILIVILAMICVSAKTEMKASYPVSFIPFWSDQKGGYETTLLNVEHIVRVVPIFNVEDIESKTNKVANAIRLEVHLSDGKVITVEEDFKEFYTRMRKAGI